MSPSVAQSNTNSFQAVPPYQKACPGVFQAIAAGREIVTFISTSRHAMEQRSAAWIPARVPRPAHSCAAIFLKIHSRLDIRSSFGQTKNSS
jgi:hypothetical protein